jgi:predicted lipoprotein with Yx(FWY)xxD motif
MASSGSAPATAPPKRCPGSPGHASLKMRNPKRRLKFRVVAVIACVIAGLHPARSLAQWVPNGSPVCTAAGHQFHPSILPDGNAGAIITWYDERNGSGIFAQRINAAGIAQWAPDGVPLVTGVRIVPPEPTIASDGAGGAIIIWPDDRDRGDYNLDIYAQRISAAGVVQWEENGVPLCTAVGAQVHPKVIADGMGGAVIAWEDRRHGELNYDIYAQRVDAAGVAQWTQDGVAVCTAANGQVDPALVSDGAQGAIVAWIDGRMECDVYAQRVSAAGIPLWTTDGVALSTAPNCQYDAVIAPDETGGAIVSWADDRAANVTDIYAQRVSASGATQWTADGVPVCRASRHQNTPAIAPDGTGGAVVSWQDYRRQTDVDVYAQRINATGVAQWITDGIGVCTDGSVQFFPAIIPDELGGTILTWLDFRHRYSIYSQRLDAGGVPQWPSNGVAICTGLPIENPPVIASDNAGGAIIAWGDERAAPYLGDIFAQRVTSEGLVGDGSTSVTISLVNTLAGPRSVTLTWHAAGASLLEARVERSAVLNDWRSLGSPTILDNDRLRYEDTSVQPGERYAYRLRYVDEGAERVSAETWVNVPTGVQLALDGFTPNPAGRTPTVSLALSQAGQATLELIDVAGRRRMTREVGSLGPGRHLVRFDDAALDAGVYIIRLRTSERELGVRGVINE